MSTLSPSPEGVPPTAAAGRAADAAASGDDQRRKTLASRRRLATGLLAVMAVCFVATLFVPEPGFAILLLRAGAEAGIVGGLADWFAVTALFRHPLGLKIPHTAIIPANQQRIAHALGRFVEVNFLTRALVLRKVRELRAGERAVRWLATPGTAARLSGWLAGALPPVLKGLDNPELGRFFRGALGDKLRQADLAAPLGRVIQAAAASPEADAALQTLVDAAHAWLNANRDRILDLVERRSRWWIPRQIDRRIADAIADGLLDVLAAMKDSSGELRGELRRSLDAWLAGLASDPERRARVNALATRLAETPELQAWLGSLWTNTSRSILDDLASPQSAVRRLLDETIASIVAALARDPATTAQVDRLTRRLALLIVARRARIADIVAEVVREWDSRTLTDRLELAVGTDLQFIRVNGTLVGAAVGCVLFLLSRALGLQF